MEQMERAAGEATAKIAIDLMFQGLGSLREADSLPLAELIIWHQIPDRETQLVNGMTAALAGRRPTGLDDVDTLALAIEHLESCAWVGVMELGYDLASLSDLVGSEIRSLPHLNRGVPQQGARLYPYDLWALVGANKLDLALYHHAHEMVRRRMSA
jgi:hypothetical protein